MTARLLRALGTAGALAAAVAVGHAMQPVVAVAAPTSDCTVQVPHSDPAPPTPLARGQLIPV